MERTCSAMSLRSWCFGTFYIKQTLPLRLTAIGSNVAFIAYAWLNGLTPILLLHGALLPLNLLRLIEQRRQMLRARALVPRN